MTRKQALEAVHRIQRAQLATAQALDLIELTEGDIVIDSKVAALIAEFDAATDKIAARIQKLIDAGGLSPESQTALQAEVDKLNLLGQNPADPVPAPAA